MSYDEKEIPLTADEQKKLQEFFASQPMRELTRGELVKLQERELAVTSMPDDKKQNITRRFHELMKKNPGWKVTKALRKAGAEYNVKFEFE